MKEKRTISKWIYYFLLGFALIIVYKLINDFGALLEIVGRFLSVIMPLILGIIIAFLFYKPVRFVEKQYSKNKILKKKARLLSTLTVYIIAILIIILGITFLIPPIKDSMTELIKNTPTYINNIKDIISNSSEDSILRNINIEELTKKAEEFDMSQYLNLGKIFEYIGKVVGVVEVIFSVFVAIILSIYILLQRGEIKKFLDDFSKATFSNSTYLKINKYFNKSNHILLDFIYCQILDGLIIGILASIAMTIMGIKYSILLGMFIGIFNIIPYFGAIIAIVISVIITIITGGVNQAAIMAIVIIILQQIDSNIINPKILGEGLKISPILVIVAVTVGGEFFGLIGMFLAVPVVAIIKVITLDYVEARIRLKNLRKSKMEQEIKKEAD